MASLNNSLLFLLLTVCSIPLQWTVSAVNCPALQKPANGKMGPDCDKPAPPGHICRFMCDDGYFLEGFEESECKKYGEWSKTTPKCEPTCPVLQDPPNGTVGKRCWREPNPPNSECFFHCDRGFYAKGKTVLICQDNSTWDHDPPTCERTCDWIDKPYKGNMTGKCSGEVKTGEVCSFTCEDGYLMKGPKEITCQADYEWTDEPPACVNRCPDITEPTGGRLQGKCQGDIKTGDKCALYCIEGTYVLVGKPEVTCQKNFDWSSQPPTCNKLECAALFTGFSRRAARTWGTFCKEGNRVCTEPKGSESFKGCGPCIDGFKEDPADPGNQNAPCIAKTKCNEVKSGSETWTRYCKALYRVCAEPSSPESRTACGQCLANYQPQEGKTGDFDSPCTARPGCEGPYNAKKPEGPNWTGHCADQYKECTTASTKGVGCGNCFRDYKPGPSPDGPCVSGADAVVSGVLLLTAVLAAILTRS